MSGFILKMNLIILQYFFSCEDPYSSNKILANFYLFCDQNTLKFFHHMLLNIYYKH